MRPSHHSPRRAAALVAAVILLAVTSMAVASAVVASGDDARTTALRAESLRALYAAESGVELAIHALNEHPDEPFTGPLELSSGAIVRTIEPFAPLPNPGHSTVAGSAGQAQRRVRITAN